MHNVGRKTRNFFTDLDGAPRVILQYNLRGRGEIWIKAPDWIDLS